MFRYTNHVCKKCFLQNDPFHKVTLNEDGVCSLCAKPAPEEAGAIGMRWKNALPPIWTACAAPGPMRA